MTDRDYGVTTIEIEVLNTILIPQVSTLRLHGLHIEQRIYIKKFHNLHSISNQKPIRFLEIVSLQAQALHLVEAEHKVHILHSLT